MSRLDRMFAAMKHRSSLTAFGIASAAFVIAFVAQPALAALIDAVGGERVVTIVAERYEYSPASVVLKKDVPVILHLVSHDRVHGFNATALGVRADVMPGEEINLRLTPHETGTFPFKCDLFCGRGHTDMTGTIVVTD